MGWAESFRHAVETEHPLMKRGLRAASVLSAVEDWQQRRHRDRCTRLVAGCQLAVVGDGTGRVGRMRNTTSG